MADINAPIEDTEVDEALVAKATLAKYRAKAKEKFRSGGFDSDKPVKKMIKLDKPKPELRKEDLHVVDAVMVEDEPDATSYIRGIEERCNLIVSEIKDEIRKTLFNFNELSTNADMVSVVKQASAEPAEKTLGKRQSIVKKGFKTPPHCPGTTSDQDLVAIVKKDSVTPAETKVGKRQSLINYESEDEITEARRKPKPGTPGGSWVDRDVADRFKKEAKEKKQFASAKREIDSLKKKGK